MSRDGSIAFAWDEGSPRRRYRLSIGHLGRIEEATGQSVFTLWLEFRTAVLLLEALAEDVLPAVASAIPKIEAFSEVIRQGLLGGGAGEAEADELVRTWVAPGGLGRAALNAERILRAALIGAPDEDPGKAGAMEAGPLSSPRMVG